MNKIVFSALAMSMASASGFASDTDWPELDRELAALNKAPLTQDAEGPYVSGWLIGAITSDDNATDPATGNQDELGTGIAAARVNIAGSVGHGYEFKLGFDFTDTNELYAPKGNPVGNSGTAGLTDAYITLDIAGEVGVQVGVFNAKFLRSGNIQRNHTLFIERSYLGGMNAARDTGVAINGSFDRINWQVAGMNGHSGTQDDFALSGHVDVDVIGTSSDYEGGYGAAEGTNLNVGASFRTDTSDTIIGETDVNNNAVNPNMSRNDDVLAVDATFTMDAFSVWGELVDYDTDSQGFGSGISTPYSVGVSYSFGEGYEVAFRWDDYDNADDVTRYNIGVNRYISGHDLKWQASFSGGSDDNTANPGQDDENNVIALGIALSF